MSLHDDDEQTSQSVDININEPGDSFFRDLFHVYDIENLGYITVDNFIQISQQNMEDGFLGDENKLKEIVHLLDPTECGQIQYFDFVEGMTKLMTNKPDGFDEGQQLISRSRSSTFMQGETPVLQKHLTEEIFENYEPDTPNSSNKTSSNEFEFADNDIEDSESLQDSESIDMFGLDSNTLKNHRKSVSIRKSISMGGLVRNSRRLSMQDSNHQGNNYNFDEEIMESHTEGVRKYEQIIEDLEYKIKNLDHQNENLKYEINEQIEMNKFQTNENSSLFQKIREIEDHNSELERKFQIQIREEKTRHQETITKLYSKQLEETEAFMNQIRSLEIESKKYATEKAKSLNKIDELKNLCDQKETLLIQENSKFKEISLAYKKSINEIESLIESNARQKFQFEEQIDNNLKEIGELKIQLENSKQEQRYQRKGTLYDESYYTNQIGQLEIENQMLKNEIQNLTTNLEDFQASLKIYQTNVAVGEDSNSLSNKRKFSNNGFLQLPDTRESFESEFSDTKEDELLEKLIAEKKNCQRLRDYVEELTSKILEINPSILEATTSQATNSIKPPIIDHNKHTSSNNLPIKNGNTEKTTSFKRLLKLVT